MTGSEGSDSAYAKAGVDIEAGDRAVELMKSWVAKTRRPEVIGGLGGFAGLFDAAALSRLEHPVLATSTDGVGTKVAIAQALDRARHDRLRPGRHGGRRSGRVRRRAAVHDRLHRLRPGPARTDRGDRAGHRRGLCGSGLRAARWRDRRAPGTARPRRVRPRRCRHRRRRAGCAARTGSRPARRRARRHRVVRTALQRVLAGAQGVRRRRLGSGTGTSTSWAGRSAKSCSSPPGSTPGAASS